MSQPNLHTLATEILLKILDGVELNVLVAIAQTSSRLYILTKTYRSVWMGAEDALALPLPAQETLSTIAVDSTVEFRPLRMVPVPAGLPIL
ncbi:hypothetical protein SISSUDRAFT_1041546 [Sistotremastrum suecicum HHB10207 ss-3]|uniref:F-box domain-containing protein n=1 Tax=Sistotremastrum suecicum HHB10207 ss-3 TaxID=1314776 RepID=A0A166H2K6_9AGAM|nr:hypothetical protein SISSUDRAFT_1041546 [Sistotremastrum suecicum HHB10207 ss-3]